MRRHHNVLAYCWHKLLAAGCAGALLAVVAGCGGAASAPSPSTPAREELKHVALSIITPEDSFAFSQNTPMNTWSGLTDALKSDALKLGLTDADMQITRTRQVDEQTAGIEQFVQRSVAHDTADTEKQDATGSNTHTAASAQHAQQDSQQWQKVLIIAPQAPTTALSKQFGDWVTRPVRASASPQWERFTRALHHAQRAGVHLILLAHPVESLTPDVYVPLADPERIGAVQAEQLLIRLHVGAQNATEQDSKQGSEHSSDTQVSKDTQDTQNKTNNASNGASAQAQGMLQPQHVELLLPCSARTTALALSNAPRETASSATNFADASPSNATDSHDAQQSMEDAADDQLSQRLFFGAWQRLEPYVRKQLISVGLNRGIATSQAHEASSDLSAIAAPTLKTADDWREACVESASTASVERTLEQRLQVTRSHAMLTRGILALNDQVAGVVSAKLATLGYEDPHKPHLSLSLINGSEARNDVERHAVPQPLYSTMRQEQEHAEKLAKPWPFITGFGAYKSILSALANGKQSLTIEQDTQRVAHDIMRVCLSMSEHQSLETLPFMRTAASWQDYAHLSIAPSAWLMEPLQVTTAATLKHDFLDTGYATLADIGL